MKVFKKVPWQILFIIYGGSIFFMKNLYAADYVFSPVSISTANILFHPENPLDNSVNLGAALGIFNRPGFYGGYNLLPADRQYWGSFIFSTGIGVFGVSYLHSASETSPEFSHGLFRAGFGKSLTPNLSFGFFLNYSYLNLNDLKSSAGIEPSLTYTIEPYSAQKPVIGIHNYFLYSSLKNLSLDFNQSTAFQPSLIFGFGAGIIKYKDFLTTFQIESSANAKMSVAPVSLALGFQYLMFQARAGYSLEIPFASPKIRPTDFTLGGGILHDFGSVYLSLQYGVKGLLHNVAEHYFSAGLVYNYADDRAPLLNVVPDVQYISPNGDGRQDYVTFKINVSDLSRVTDWKLEIKNARGEAVKTFSKDKRSRSVYFPLYRIVTDLFEDRQYQDIPRYIIWDGSSENLNINVSTLVNPPSIALPDGIYFYEMRVSDAKGMNSDPVRGNITIDTVVPEINLKRDNVYENKDSGTVFSATQLAPNQNEDMFTGIISDEAGHAVKTYSWAGAKSFPKQLKWDGSDDENLRVPDGYYRYELTAMDIAGNANSAFISNIAVNNSPVHAEIFSETDGFSPNNDGKLDTIKFEILPAKINDNFTWNIFITKEKITTEKTKDMKNVVSVVAWTGTKENFPASITWDGKDTKQNLSGDGIYFVTLIIDHNGEVFFTSRSFVLDTRVPEISVSSNMQGISPDNDKIKDDGFFYLAAHDKSRIKSYSLNLYEILQINGKTVRVPFKSWSAAKAPPEKIYFNGISEKGLLMESLQTYEIETSVTDIYENTKTGTSGEIYSGLLASDQGSRLKITLTGLKYNKTSDPLKYDRLNALLSLLLYDYPEYKVRIEVHTNSVGGEEANLKASELRARKIMRYFHSRGLSYDRSAYQGFGEIIPLSEIQGEIVQYKNDRLECILIK